MTLTRTVVVAAAAASSADALPPLVCKMIENQELEKTAVDTLCNKVFKAHASECEMAVTKIWNFMANKGCSKGTLTAEALPPMFCKVAKNSAVEGMIINKACAKQSKVPATECEAALKKFWDELVAKECPNAHPDRLAQIEEIKNTPGVLWKAAVHERFASEAPGASRPLNGVKGDWVSDIKAAVERGEIHQFAGELSSIKDETIPESFDSAQQWPHCAKTIGDIRDQSNCGCCWAFAAAEAASDRMCIATNATMMLPLSAQDVCFCAEDDGCDGGQITTPWNYIHEHGAVSGGQYQGTGPFGKGMCSDFSLPHCHHHGPQGSDPYPAEGAAGCPHQSSPACPKKCDTEAASPHGAFESDKYSFTGQSVTAGGVTGVQKLIMEGGPVETAFTVYSDFENYAGGIYHHVSGSMAGGHAVKIVGWGSENGVKYWKVANSWNPYWGEQGYFRIKQGEGGIDDSVIGSSPDAKWSKKGDSTVVV